MYTKTICPYCEKGAFHYITATVKEDQKEYTFEKIEVTDSLSEEQFIQLISNFISKNKEKGITTYTLENILTGCIGLSPQLTEEIEKKIQLTKNCSCVV